MQHGNRPRRLRNLKAAGLLVGKRRAIGSNESGVRKMGSSREALLTSVLRHRLVHLIDTDMSLSLQLSLMTRSRLVRHFLSFWQTHLPPANCHELINRNLSSDDPPRDICHLTLEAHSMHLSVRKEMGKMLIISFSS